MRSSSLSLSLCGLTLLLAGCGQPPEPKFSLNAKTAALTPAAQQLVSEALVENFGTPNNLVAWQELPIDYGKGSPTAAEAHRQADGWRLKEGRDLYMVHCLHCHGVAGDGNGTTARFLNPRPRDYRQGKYKFKSTAGGNRPTHDDLMRILEEGIAGTYMPSFALLGKDQLGLLVDYVRWLSMRGEIEEGLAIELAQIGLKTADLERTVREKRTEDKSVTLDTVRDELLAEVKASWSDTVAEKAKDVVDFWNEANNAENLVMPVAKRVVADAESIARGRALYLSKENKCSDCHGPAGRGDGPQTEQFSAIDGASPARNYDEPGLRDAWGNIIMPRNLTRGVYRFGRRPLDIYRRVHQGINGTPMPGFGKTLKDEQIWDIVNYVLSIPHQDGTAPAPEGVAGGETLPETASR